MYEESSHVISYSFPHPEVKLIIRPGPNYVAFNPNSLKPPKRNKTFQTAFSLKKKWVIKYSGMEKSGPEALSLPHCVAK